MADLADIANDQMEQLMTLQLASRPKPADIQGDGYCLVCDAPVAPVMYKGEQVTPRWCCEEHREAWARDYTLVQV